MNEQKTILVVEDDEVDVMTIKRAMKEIHVTNPVEVRWNGEEALEYLQGERELPGIVLLDLNMPRMNGMEFLQQVRSDERLKRIPLVVLTTSREEQERFSGFNLGVAGYMIKPVDYLQFVEVIRAINLYWTLSELP